MWARMLQQQVLMLQQQARMLRLRLLPLCTAAFLQCLPRLLQHLGESLRLLVVLLDLWVQQNPAQHPHDRSLVMLQSLNLRWKHL